MKWLYVMLCCLMAAGLTSCLGDDDNDNTNQGLTAAEVAQCLTAVRGSYDGQVTFTNGDEKKDTLDGIHWSITNDSLVTISHVPVDVFLSRLSNTELREAFDGTETFDMVCYIRFYNTNPVCFWINPSATALTLHYGDADHEVCPVFYINNNYSFGALESGELYMQVVLAGIYIDGSLSSSALGSNSAVPLLFFVKK